MAGCYLDGRDAVQSCLTSIRLSDSSLSYSELLSMVESERIGEVVIQGQELFVTDINNKKFKVFAPQDADLIRILRNKGIAIKAQPPVESPWYMSMLASGFR